jgi:ribonuclease Z
VQFQLTTLGISAAGPVPGRWPSGQYLKTHRTGFLIDCGEGIQIALQRNRISWSSIDIILISHMHGDHIYGLPGLLTSWALNRRTKPLIIIGPAGLSPYLKHVFEYSYTGLPYEVTFVVADPATASELIFADKMLEVTTLPLLHRIPTVGYLVKEKPRPRTMSGAAIEKYAIPYAAIPAIKRGEDFVNEHGDIIPNNLLTFEAPASRSFAYCSDTRPNPTLLPYLQDVDLLFHEATFLQELAEQAELSGHSTARQAAEIAREAGVGQLILGHFSPRYDDLSILLDEAREVFPNSELAREGRHFRVAYEGREE